MPKLLLLAVGLLASFSFAADAPAPAAPHVRTLYEGSNFTPPADKAVWEKRAQYLREQVLIAAGLYPLPEKTPLNAVIHTPVDRGTYTVEHVFFESYPGFFVSGNLYRPKGKAGPLPAVLSPHGHWGEPDGRFYHASDNEVAKQLKGGWETEESAARYPLQARCANLAMLGCIVFHYDMVGYADADRGHFPHRRTFTDFESSQWGLSIFGLQTWNSIRAMDFVLSLPEVDPERIACTGASGGATQTFILMNADPRLKVAAPVCMISAGNHQGGCVCENSYYLRLDTDNVELAATFAPKPLVHPTATGDWTAHFLEQGYPQLKAIYKLYDAEANVLSERFQSEHNYNKNSREMVYNFFNTHLKLGQPSPIAERPFTPINPHDLSVFTVDHPRPARAVTAEQLKAYLIEQAKKQSLTREQLEVALRHMIARRTPSRDPGVAPSGKKSVTVVVNAHGGAAVSQALRDELVKNNQTVITPDVFLSNGEKMVIPPNTEFFTGYNRTILANRVRDILAAIETAQNVAESGPVELIGEGGAGPWCILAAGLAEGKLNQVIVHTGGFDFDAVASDSDPNYQPLALRYGGLYKFASLVAPAELQIHAPKKCPAADDLKASYEGKIQFIQELDPKIQIER